MSAVVESSCDWMSSDIRLFVHKWSLSPVSSLVISTVLNPQYRVRLEQYSLDISAVLNQYYKLFFHLKGFHIYVLEVCLLIIQTFPSSIGTAIFFFICKVFVKHFPVIYFTKFDDCCFSSTYFQATMMLATVNVNRLATHKPHLKACLVYSLTEIELSSIRLFPANPF